MILYGAAVKLFLYAALIIRVAFPWKTGITPIDWVAFLGLSVVLAGAVGVVESVMARLRLPRIPTFLVVASLLSAFGIILLMR
jgi:formate hydrogenlyase subunit 4